MRGEWAGCQICIAAFGGNTKLSGSYTAVQGQPHSRSMAWGIARKLPPCASASAMFMLPTILLDEPFSQSDTPRPRNPAKPRRSGNDYTNRRIQFMPFHRKGRHGKIPAPPRSTK